MRLDLCRFLGIYLNHSPQSCDGKGANGLDPTERGLVSLGLVLAGGNLPTVAVDGFEGVLHLFFECHKPSFAGFIEVVQLW